MIYLAAVVLLLTVWRLTVRARREGGVRVFKSIAVAALSGLLAGLFIGVGARVGMAAIPVANGGAPILTPAGSLTVVFTFASYGVPLGVVYEILFRHLLRSNGLAYGGLLTLVSWYPLAQAGAQQLTGQPALVPLVIVSGLIVALMWLPFGISLEALLRRWHRRGAARATAGATA